MFGDTFVNTFLGTFPQEKSERFKVSGKLKGKLQKLSVAFFV